MIILASVSTVVLDLSYVTAMDGAGIGAIAYLFRHLSAGGRGLRVTGAQGQPLAFLRDLGLTAALGLPPSRRSARMPYLPQTRAA